MESTKIPFNLYDHIAIIFPGVLLLPLIYYYFPETHKYFVELKDTSSVMLVLLLIIISFIAGHAIYNLSRRITDVLNKCLNINKDKFLEYDKVK